MDSCHRVCSGSLPFRHPSKAVFVQVFFIPPICHQLSLSFLLLCSLVSPALHRYFGPFSDLLLSLHLMIFCMASWFWVMQVRPHSYLFSISLCVLHQRSPSCRVRAAFSSNSRASLIVGSGFAYKCTATLILVILHSASNDFIPRPPIFLGR